MKIRKAEKKDIPRILALLGQVLQIHAEIRPDIFIPGTTKYTPCELAELLEQEDHPIYVAVDEDDLCMGYAFCQLREQPFSTNMVPFKSYRLIRRIKRKKTRQGESKEKFIYNFMLEFISRDLELLGHYEKRIMDLEEGVMDGKIQGFQNAIMPIRRELLTLRSYYDEIMDMGKQLEENENGFFAKKQVKYFGVISDRADRLMSKASQLLEYAQQVRDAYKAQVDAQQNNNMQFLTVISTIFFPLTLITSWYGMNFHNMPELKHGYPGVIILSVVVMITCIIIFKRKKML